MDRKRVFLLGAGFSRAINGRMPMLDELSKAVRDSDLVKAADLQHGPKRYGDDVERWLTAMADPGPWLTPAQAHRARSDFATVSEAVAKVISERDELVVRKTPIPPWLAKLVRSWHERQETVITFNYDRLVETACYTVLKPVDSFLGDARDLYPIALTPAASRRGATAGIAGKGVADTFKLLKLHGSLSWWGSGLDGQPSDPIYFTEWTGVFNRGIRVEPPDPKLLIADLFEVIIPPVATKTPFYSKRILASQWSLAAKALQELQEGDELLLMGYSLPLTDLTVANLISSNLHGRRINIIPVNLPDTSTDQASTEQAEPASSVVKNLKTLLPDHLVNDEYIRPGNPIEAWADAHANLDTA